jgi:dCMP deaminase
MIIGITGLDGSGKSQVANLLEQSAFFKIRFSEILAEELKKRKRKVTKESLIAMGNELREKFGPKILARLALHKVQDGENYVFVSMRNPAEVQLLQSRHDFLLVNITAPERVRLKRIIRKRLDSSPKSLKELRRMDALESSSNPKKQQLHKVTKMARAVIKNDSSEKRLKQKVERMLSDWMYKLQDQRPTWDYYFMDIAETVKIRSSCMSPKKGALIVKDKQILSTGYNGTPRGVSHCTSGACKRCTLRHSGKIKSADYTSAICICAHAEENAIVQAANTGVSTKGATIYTTFTPCNMCARMIINAGIKEVVAKVTYPDDVGTKLLKEAGVKLRVLR